MKKQRMSLDELGEAKKKVVESWKAWDDVSLELGNLIGEYQHMLSDPWHGGWHFQNNGIVTRFSESFFFAFPDGEEIRYRNPRSDIEYCLVERGAGLWFELTVSGMVKIDYFDWALDIKGTEPKKREPEPVAIVDQSTVTDRTKVYEILNNFVDKALSRHWAIDMNRWGCI
jgi:hypothetical protein